MYDHVCRLLYDQDRFITALVDNLQSIIYLPRILCLCVCVCVTICVGTLCYSFSFNNQTDQGDQTEGLEREG